MRLNEKLTKWAAVAVLSIGGAASALAGSVTRPGDTIGAASGMPVPPGVYFANTFTRECRDTSPEGTCATVDVPILAWSTPWTILGARLQLATAPVVPLTLRIHDTADPNGLFNPFVAAQLAWALGNNWGFSYLLGTYTDTDGSIAYSSTSLNQRFALSYTGNGWNLTANAIWGINFDEVTSKPQVSPCPVSAAFPHNGCNPNFLNVDLTATKRFGRWELGPVGLYSTDLNAPIAAYQKESQWAFGGLVGYYFDRMVVQAYVTSDVDENDYGGSLTAGNFRIVVPLGKPSGGPPPVITQ